MIEALQITTFFLCLIAACSLAKKEPDPTQIEIEKEIEWIECQTKKNYKDCEHLEPKRVDKKTK